MQAIQDFEKEHKIPSNWLNYAIRNGDPNGSWQKLERGEIKLDADFYTGFTADLQNPEAWASFLRRTEPNEKKTSTDLANPTQLGDPVSLKAEAADSNPIEDEKGAVASSASSERDAVPKASLSKLARDTTIGDPVSLESEAVVEHPPSPSPSASSPSPSSEPNSPPEIDSEALFWAMMSTAQHPDPYIFPALQRLRQLNPRPIIAALSNTVPLPAEHPFSQSQSQLQSQNHKHGHNQANGPKSQQIQQQQQAEPDFSSNLSSHFDVYITSSSTGMRKPDRAIYEHALRQLNTHAAAATHSHSAITLPIEASDVVFLDDIGENVKMAREMGMQTIKVQMGRTWVAVEELERELGGEVELLDKSGKGDDGKGKGRESKL